MNRTIWIARDEEIEEWCGDKGGAYVLSLEKPTKNEDGVCWSAGDAAASVFPSAAFIEAILCPADHLKPGEGPMQINIQIKQH